MDWIIKKPDKDAVEGLARETGLTPIMAGLLVGRGIYDAEGVRSFLKPSLKNLPSPFLLPDMDKAVNRLIKALSSNENICIYGDYDADGLTSTALLADFLGQLGAEVTTYIPHRIEEGYGFNVQAAEKLASMGVNLIVTVDCGVSDFEAAARAAELGVDVIITDHHQVGESMPPCSAVVNPHRKDSRFPQAELAGVGVAFFLAGGLRQALREQGIINKRRQPELVKLLSLVAIGTIADVVPLTRVNRDLTAMGLERLAMPDRPGLTALMEAGSLDAGTAPSSIDVAFRLAPRLNAPGRLGSPQPGLDLLTTNEPGRAEECAGLLDKLNIERRRIQADTIKQASAMFDEVEALGKRTILLANEGWHRGVVGLAASKLAEKYNRPAILMTVENGMAHGSGRSVKGFNIYRALCNCGDHMVKFGGHAQAAGLTAGAEQLEALAEAFEEAALSELGEEAPQPSLEIDAEATVADLCGAAPSEMARLAPFGAGNPEPVLALKNLNVLSACCVGAKDSHLRLNLSAEGRCLDLFGFGLGDMLPEIGRNVSIAVQRHKSKYKGRTVMTWKILDVKKAGQG